MAKLIDPSEVADRKAARADVGTITIRLDPESMAILERLAAALEALVKQQGIAPPQQSTPSHLGPFLGKE